MFLNPRSNLFNFQFTKNFIPEKIVDKYEPYLNKVRGFPIKNVGDFINYSIQGINLPGINTDVTEQLMVGGRKRAHRNTLPSQELLSKEMTVTLRLADGYINYWMLFDLLSYYYSFDTKDKYIPDQRVQILDSDGNIITSIELKRILLTNISDLDLNFSTNTPEFQTFTISLIYNELEIKQVFDSSN